jgi:hypothetical protein
MMMHAEEVSMALHGLGEPRQRRRAPHSVLEDESCRSEPFGSVNTVDCCRHCFANNVSQAKLVCARGEAVTRSAPQADIDVVVRCIVLMILSLI